MGQTLGEPIKTKHSSTCGNDQFKVGSSSMQGWRMTMEDAHTHLLALPDDENASFFAVYDGHGGAKVSEYAGVHLHKKIVNNKFYKEDKISEAIQHGFLDLDKQMVNDDDIKQEMSGTTAVTVLIKNNIVYCGNVGDSRAVSCINGVAMPLSFDHKPGNEDEQKRIHDAGGWVEYNRVNGNLALSRALGDFIYKRNDAKLAKDQIVTAYPDIFSCELNKDVEFLVIACDGIWDCMTNEEVVEFCRERLQKRMEPEAICEELLDKCLSPDCGFPGFGCDNMTVILVLCLLGDTMEEFYTRVSRTISKYEVINPIQMRKEVASTVYDHTFTSSALSDQNTSTTNVWDHAFSASSELPHVLKETGDENESEDETAMDVSLLDDIEDKTQEEEMLEESEDEENKPAEIFL
jgi:protein phosphatase 2C family protein 2/3|uniref:PPM-type phosphatase domain-containing protein n=1 Tax=Panagrolaimus sp. PS1159 TaxID=55785 RepID=A0AC35GMB1_9BILA